MLDYNTTAVAFGDLKNAALYFDYLVPVYLAVDLHTNRSEWDSLVGRQHDLVPPALLSRPGFGERFVAVNQATSNWFLKLAIQHFGLESKIGGLSEEQYASIEYSAVSEYFRFVDEYDLTEYPLISAGGSTSAWMEDDDRYASSPIITLMNLKLVDASSVPWEQIIEFRRDREARTRLRRLRLFAYENYAGHAREYIEDDVLTRVAEYEETARQWGLETVHGALSVVLNSKLTASLIAGTFLSALFGQPTSVALSAAAGAVVELGHIGVEIGRRRFALRKLIRDSPVSFVSYSQAKLQLSSAR
jgi:hypothetical protein